MGLTYFKRFRMEIDLTRGDFPSAILPPGYRLIPFDQRLIPAHAEAKYRSFRSEMDANVFPSLGDAEGCLRLMTEISRKDGFLPESTWLLAFDSEGGCRWTRSRFEAPRFDREYCGTVQGVRDAQGIGSIQNLGIVPEHRGRGLGSLLLGKCLRAFRESGMRRAGLEVTARNESAIRLYRRIGFVKSRTVYKAVETPSYALV